MLINQGTLPRRPGATPATSGRTGNPYVFIVGCSRSGTTLLKRMIDSHPRIAIPRKSKWITHCFEERIGLTPEGHVTPALIRWLAEFPRFGHLRLERTAVERLITRDAPLSYADFVSGVYDLYGKAKGKPLVGDQTPRYVRSIDLLHALWLGAQFVHIVRDGRDVALSMLDPRRAERDLGHFATWREDPVATAALRWEWNVRLGIEAGRPLGSGLYYEMHYEALVRDPEGECAALCRFLKVPYDAAMTRYHEGRVRAGEGLTAKDAWLPPTPRLRDWKSQMPTEEVERFEAVAGDLLDELGYGRALAHRTAPASMRRRVRDLRRRFDARPRPETW